MKVLKNCSYIHNPREQLFYCGISCEGVHLFEKEKRNGYTEDITKAGKFTNVEANGIVQHFESSGYQRWCVPVGILDYLASKEV